MAEHTHDPSDWTPKVAPEGATEWETNEAIRSWRNAISYLTEARDRIDGVLADLMRVDPNDAKGHPHPHALRLANAAQKLAEGTYDVAAYYGVRNGCIHRQAEDRHRRDGQLDASRRVAAYLALQAQLRNQDHEQLHTVVVRCEPATLLASDLRALIDAVEPF